MSRYHVTVTKKQTCWDIEASSYEEAQELALKECKLNPNEYDTCFDIDEVRELKDDE